MKTLKTIQVKYTFSHADFSRNVLIHSSVCFLCYFGFINHGLLTEKTHQKMNVKPGKFGCTLNEGTVCRLKSVDQLTKIHECMHSPA